MLPPPTRGSDDFCIVVNGTTTVDGIPVPRNPLPLGLVYYSRGATQPVDVYPDDVVTTDVYGDLETGQNWWTSEYILNYIEEEYDDGILETCRVFDPIYDFVLN